MAIIMLLYCAWLYEKGYVGPCLCLAIINLVPLIGHVKDSKCFLNRVTVANTHIMPFRVLLAHHVANTLGDLGLSETYLR